LLNVQINIHVSFPSTVFKYEQRERHESNCIYINIIPKFIEMSFIKLAFFSLYRTFKSRAKADRACLFKIELLFYDTFSVTKLYSVNDWVTSE
jgi:hypothetical protein